MTTVKSDGLGREQMQRNGVAGEGVNNEDIEILWRLTGQRGARVTGSEAERGGRVAQVREQVLRDGENHRVDLVKAHAVPRASIGSKRPGTQSDHADIFGPDRITITSAAETQSETHTGVVGVVGGWDPGEARGKDLRAMLDSPIEQHAHGIAAMWPYRLLYPESAVEVSHLQHRLSGVRGMQHNREEQKQPRSSSPQQPLPPAVMPGHHNGQGGSDEERKREIVVRGEQQRAGNADQESSGGSSGRNQQVEEGRFAGTGRTQGEGLGVTEESGKKGFGEEEQNSHAIGKLISDFEIA